MPKQSKKKKLKLSGLDYTQDPNSKISSSGQVENNILRPCNKTTFVEEGKVLFQINTGRKWVRFLPNPLVIKYLAWEKIVKTTGEDAEKVYCNDSTNFGGISGMPAFSPYFINPAILGSAFFEDYKLYINRNLINLGKYQNRDQVS